MRKHNATPMRVRFQCKYARQRGLLNLPPTTLLRGRGHITPRVHNAYAY